MCLSPQEVPETQGTPQEDVAESSHTLNHPQPSNTSHNSGVTASHQEGADVQAPEPGIQDVNVLQYRVLLETVGLLKEELAISREELALLKDQTKTNAQKIPEPDFYKGKDINEYRLWVRDLDDYLDNKKNVYSTEPERVKYAAGRVRGEPKTIWNQAKPNLKLETYTLDDFKAFLLNQLESERDRGMTLVFELQELRQQPGESVKTFYIKYRDLLNGLDPSNRGIDSSYWWQLFIYKLLPWLQRAIIKDATMPRTLQDLYELACRLEKLNEITNRNQKKEKKKDDEKGKTKDENPKKPHQNPNSNHKFEKPSDSNVNSNSNPKSSSQPGGSTQSKKRSGGGKPATGQKRKFPFKITPEEKQKRISEGKCIACGASDHWAPDCPKRNRLDGEEVPASKPTTNKPPNASNSQ